MSCVDEKIIEETNKILEKYKKEKDNLIPILNDIQVKFGYIPKRSQIEISKYLQIPMAEIFGVITFYSRFSLEPRATNTRIKINLSFFIDSFNTDSNVFKFSTSYASS